MAYSGKSQPDFPDCFIMLDKLCNVCGLFYPRDKLENVTQSTKVSYMACYQREILSGVSYAPKKICYNCRINLSSGKALRISVPMLWYNHRFINKSNHEASNCYCCQLPSFVGHSASTRKNLKYPYHITSVPLPKWNDSSSAPLVQVPSPNDIMEIGHEVSVLSEIKLLCNLRCHIIDA